MIEILMALLVGGIAACLWVVVFAIGYAIYKNIKEG